MSINEKSFDFIPLLKGQARFFLGNPVLLAVLLLGVCFAAFFTYNEILFSEEKAGLAALLFTVIWGFIYIIIPYFIIFFIVIAVLAAIAGVFYIAGSAGGSEGVGAVAVVGLVIAIIAALVGVAVIVGPGYLAYEAMESSGNSQMVSVATAIALSIVLLIILALLYRIVWPVFITVIWVYFSAHLSMKAVALTLGIVESVDYVQKMSNIDLPENLDDVLAIITELFEIYISMAPPGPLAFAMLVFSVIMSLLILVKGSTIGDMKLWQKNKASEKQTEKQKNAVLESEKESVIL